MISDGGPANYPDITYQTFLMIDKQSNLFWSRLHGKYARSLHPIDSSMEIIFGLIMVLTFTCSISAAESGRQEIRTMLWAAIGCNLAWGILDAIMFLMSRLLERAEIHESIIKIRNAKEPQQVRQSVRDAITPFLADHLSDQQISGLHHSVSEMPELPKHSFLTRRELRNAVQIFFLVFISTFPVITPFFFFHDQPITALRISNAIAIILLFIAGYLLGRKTGYSPWISGLLFTLIGIALVFMTISLGG
jgi:VIT1/CCC1 family predicted Fe2+/Mn2+ transporter